MAFMAREPFTFFLIFSLNISFIDRVLFRAKIELSLFVASKQANHNTQSVQFTDNSIPKTSCFA